MVASQARDYTCCGLDSNDPLHALVNHSEECHAAVIEPYTPWHAEWHPPPRPAHSTRPRTFPTQAAPSSQKPMLCQVFALDGLETDAGQNQSAPPSGAPSPPDTPVPIPFNSGPSAPPSHALADASESAPPIPAFDATAVLPSGAHHTSGFRSSVSNPVSGSVARAEDASNAYAEYWGYSSLFPETDLLGGVDTALMQQQQNQMASMSFSPVSGNQVSHVPTALLLSSTAGNTPASTPASSRVASPAQGSTTTYRNASPPGLQSAQASLIGASASNASGGSKTAYSSMPRASTTLSLPASLLLSSRPFRCPMPNCNKSYKQANGLKYHIAHGSCNFAPPKDLAHVQELLAIRRSEKAAKACRNRAVATEAEVTLSDTELKEVVEEAERRMRPYACSVGNCQRRFKSLNGLRAYMRLLSS